MSELISTLLIAGAAISVGTVVREATKDCYAALKGKVAELFGQPTADSLAVLEQQPTDAAARHAITTAAEAATPAQLEALSPLVDAFKEAMVQDEAARRLAHNRGHIDLTLNVAGNIDIARVDSASGIHLRAAAGGNFSLTDVSMARSGSRGN